MLFVNIVSILIGLSTALFGGLIRNGKNMHLININLEEIPDTNRDTFCRRASLAVVVIGCAIMLSGIGNIFFPSPLLAVGYTAVFAAGMLIFVSAMRKYGSTEETKKR